MEERKRRTRKGKGGRREKWVWGAARAEQHLGQERPARRAASMMRRERTKVGKDKAGGGKREKEQGRSSR